MISKGLTLKVSHKTIAVTTAIIIISFATLAMLSAESYFDLQTIDPAAVLAALVVVVLGLVWFRKTLK